MLFLHSQSGACSISTTFLLIRLQPLWYPKIAITLRGEQCQWVFCIWTLPDVVTSTPIRVGEERGGNSCLFLTARLRKKGEKKEHMKAVNSCIWKCDANFTSYLPIIFSYTSNSNLSRQINISNSPHVECTLSPPLYCQQKTAKTSYQTPIKLSPLGSADKLLWKWRLKNLCTAQQCKSNMNWVLMWAGCHNKDTAYKQITYVCETWG